MKPDLKQLLLQTKGEKNIARKAAIEKCVDYYTDSQMTYLDELLKEHFSDYQDNKLKILKKTVPITQYVIDSISLVFNTKHYFEIQSESESDKKIWAEIVSNLKWDFKSFNSTLNSYVNITGSPAVKWSWRNGSIQPDIITPDLIDIIQNPEDVTEADAVTYTRQRTDTVTDTADIVNYLWTKDDFYVFDEDGRPATIEGNPEGKNPYGIIPIVFIRNGIPVNQFWVEPELSLVEANENINFHLCELNHLVKFQAFSVMVIAGTNKEIKEIKVGAGSVVRLPFGTPGDPAPTLTFASPNPKIVEVLELIKSDITQICTFFHIDASNFVLSGSANSGLSIELKQKALVDIVKDSRSIYINYIKESFEVIKRIWNYENKSRQISEKATLKLLFVDSKQTNVADQVILDEFDLKYDLTSKVHIMMGRGMTEAEAIEYLDKVNEYNAKFPVNTID